MKQCNNIIFWDWVQGGKWKKMKIYLPERKSRSGFPTPPRGAWGCLVQTGTKFQEREEVERSNMRNIFIIKKKESANKTE